MTFWEKKWVIAAMAFAGSVGGTLLSYSLGEGSKAKWQEREWKQARYNALMVGAEGFLDTTEAARRPELIQKFLAEEHLCRIYCPDHIVKQLNVFTDTMFSPPETYPGRDRSLFYRNLQLELRKDLWPQTALTEKDFNFR